MSVVNIFSASFCGAEEAAQEVAADLSFRLLRDEDIIGRAARRGRLSAGVLRRAMYGRPSLFNQFTHERERAVCLLKLAMAELFQDDGLVFLGAAALLSPNSINHVLDVCLVADHKFRTDRAVRELGLSDKEAQARVHRDDEAAVRWAETLGPKLPWDPSRHDILLPMDKTGFSEAVRIVCDHARGGSLAPTMTSMAAAADFRLAAEVELVIVEAGHNPREALVSANQGRIVIQINRKVLRLGHLSEELRKLALKVEGVEDVEVTTGPEYYQADVYRQAEFHLPSKVLLVDDEQEFVQTLSERLQMRQIGSAVAYDGEQALRVMSEEEPEVIVLDLKMPGMEGEEVLRRIKRDYPKVEVIILTGHGSEKDKETCLQLGAFEYLEKPVDIDRLSEAVRLAHEKVERG